MENIKFFKAKIVKKLPEYDTRNERWRMVYRVGEIVYAFKTQNPKKEPVYVIWAGGNFGTINLAEEEARRCLSSVRQKGKVAFLPQKQNQEMNQRYWWMITS